MTSVDNVGIKLGQIIVDKETGRTKMTQEVQGVDLGTYFTKLKEAKMFKVEQQADIIDINNKKLVALNDFKSKALALDKAVAVMANRLGNKEQVGNVMLQKAVSVTSSGAISPENLLRIDYFDEAKVGAFKMKVNQIATADSYQTRISVPDLYGALGLEGTFTIGTIEKGSAAQVKITSDMTLSQVTQAINAVSDKTRITADFSLISPSDPTGYEFRLSTKQLSTPIILQDNSGDILTSWNMIPGQKVSVQSGPTSITANKQTNLGLTGNLVVGAGSATATTIDTSGLTLQDIADQINSNTGTSKVTATIVPVYAVNALSSDLPIGYGLSLSSTNNQPINLSNSNAAVMNGLQLQSAITTSTNSFVSAKDPATDQGMTGNLVVQAGARGTAYTIDTAGKSLNAIVKEINDNTDATGVFAKLQVLIPANSSDSESKNLYQLTLATNNGTSLITSASDTSAISGLGLNAPAHDYQTMVAKVNVNGVDYQRFTNTLHDIVPSLTFNLKSADPSSTLNVDVTQSKEGTMTGLSAVMTAYNDLNSFYKTQTAMKDDFSAPLDGALLYDDYYVKNFMQKLQQTLCSVVIGPENGSLMGLSSIGLKLNSDDGTLFLENEKLWNESLNKNYNNLVALFENTVKNTNSSFHLAEVPNFIDASIEGKDINVSLANDPTLGAIATINVNGKTYEANISVVEHLVTIVPKDLTSSIGQFQFYYNAGMPASGQTVTTTFNIVPGVMARVDGLLLTEMDSNKVKDEKVLPPFDVKGAMFQNINLLQDKNKKLGDDIEQLKKSIEKEMESVERRFDAVLESKARYQMVQGLLKSFLKANSH